MFNTLQKDMSEINGKLKELERERGVELANMDDGNDLHLQIQVKNSPEFWLNWTEAAALYTKRRHFLYTSVGIGTYL